MFKPIEQPFGSNNCVVDQTIPQTYAMTCIIVTSKLHINKLRRERRCRVLSFFVSSENGGVTEMTTAPFTLNGQAMKL